MIILFLLLAACSFLLGFVLGVLKKPPMEKLKSRSVESDITRLQKEYENFLNYDGTVQELP